MIKLACVHVRVHELFLFGFRIIPGSDLLLRSLDEPNDQDELTLTVLTGDASAQSRTFYNTNGKVVGPIIDQLQRRGRLRCARPRRFRTRRSSPSAKHASQSGTWVMDRLSAVT